MEIVLLCMLLGLIPAFIAHSKGRSAFGWWLYGALLFIVALPHALLLKKRPSEGDDIFERDNLKASARYPCSNCAEAILPAAIGKPLSV